MNSDELQNSLDGLATVVDRPHTQGEAPSTDVGMLDAVINQIAAVLGSADVKPETVSSGPFWVQHRIESTGVRTRVVELIDKSWFKRSTLCLVGFTQDENKPVALLPTLSSYRIFDPATGVEQRVTSDIARGLADTAYMVYPTFRPGPITWRTLVGLLRSQLRGQLWVIFALSLLAALIALITPIMVGLIFNQVLPHQQPQLLAGVGILLAGAALTTAVVEVCSSLASARLIGRLEAIDESALMDRVMALPSSFIRKFSTGDLGARLSGLQQIRNRALSILLSSGLGAVMSIVSLVLLFVYSPRLAGVAFVALVILLTIVVMINVHRVNQQREMLDQAGKVDSELFEWVRAIPKIQVAGAERRIMARWSNDFSVQQGLNVSSGRTGTWSTALLTAMSAILALVLYLFAGTFFVGDLNGGSYLAFYSALGQFMAAVVGLTATIAPIIEIIARWNRLKPIFDEQEEKFGTQSPGTLQGAIKVSNVSFSYSGASQQVLTDVDFEIKSGEFVAITGTSGSGKSTLLRLLLGLDRPTSGSVSYDGVDLNLLDVRQVRSQLGVVIQNARPLPGELMETILGESDGDEALAWAAAEAAGVADDIDAMPMKMKTLIGEGAATFSGGQVQRLMIARALARRPRILLFDEATSALDDRTQQRVAENIEQMAVTRIAIAHRLSTVRNADKIVVLEQGRVVDQGTFDELMNRPGSFREMAQRQLTEDVSIGNPET